MSVKTMIAELVKARKAYNRKLKELGKDTAQEVAKFLAPLIPTGYTLQWTQFTPYFNDGEPCEFGVNEPYLVRDGAKDAYHLDDRGISVYRAYHRYGQPDQEKYYMTTDYRNRTYDAERKDFVYPQRKVTYVEPGFPAIDGYSKENLRALLNVWDDLPKDLMLTAFGDHVTVAISPAGTYTVSGYDHD